MDKAASQADAVRKLEAVGVSIGYLHEWDHVKDKFSGAPPPGGKLLRSMFGDHMFLVPDTIIVSEYSGSLDSLKSIGELETVTKIGIVDSQIGDEILPTLMKLDALNEISLFGTTLTDQGLLRLADLPKLRGLVVTNTKVSAEGVESFKKLRSDCKVHNEDIDP